MVATGGSTPDYFGIGTDTNAQQIVVTMNDDIGINDVNPDGKL